MNRIIEAALRQRSIVLMLLVAVLVGGAVAFHKLNIEAYPDPVPPLVDVITLSAGQAPEDVERYLTIPVEVQMAGLPHVTAIRTISLFGLSDTNIQFTYDVTYEQAEQLVLNRLSQMPALPNGALPRISAESPIGEIYRYRLEGPPGYSATDLKTLEDWVLVRRFKAIPGVVDVTSWGGKDKTFEVTIDQNKLVHYGLTVPQVIQVLNNNSINVGAQTINIGPQSAVVRGLGLMHSADDILKSVVATPGGTPVFISDIATVSVTNAPRLGIAGQDDRDDIVEGVILMRRGEESLPTIARVKAEVAKINESGVLPPGVHVAQIYDRTDLIQVTTHTVLENMLLGMTLIFFVQWVFLGDLRSAIIVSATIPFALACAVLIMMARGESANLLSIGAIDFGLIVDATVIIVENVFRHLSGDAATRPLHAPGNAGGLNAKTAQIAFAAKQVARSIFFSAAIIIAGFVPLFTLSGVEGHIFGPMARTYGYAIAGGLIATFTVSPVLASLLLRAHVRETETWLVHKLRRLYSPAVRMALGNPVVTLGCAGMIMLLAGVASQHLGAEFLPHLEEGNLWIRATLPPAISLEEGDAPVNAMRRLIGSFPEVATVVSQHGRPDDGSDATGFFNTEFFVPLKPFNTWPHGVDKAALTDQMRTALEGRFPGVDFNFSQYIEDNVEESASGVKGENSVKLYGNDLAVLQKTANDIKAAMAKVPGIADLGVFDVLGQPTISIDIDRARAARYGLATGDINATVQAAIGGQPTGNVYEENSDRNFPVNVRLASQYRESVDSMRNVEIGAQTSNGLVQVPLGEVANVNLTSGASFVYRENQERYIPIKFSVRGRDLGGAVLDAQARIARDVHLPSGYRLEWVGEFGEFQEAIGRLAIAVPISVLLIAVLLYTYFGSFIDAALAACAIPLTLVGGIFALVLTGTAFSVSAAIGFVALFGIAAMDGIVLVSYFNRMMAEGMERGAGILRTCQTQMRPVAMTCAVASIGLLPAALSTGIGSQVQKPLAIVVVGGFTIAPALILLVLPLLILLFSPHGRTRDVSMPAVPEPAE